MISFHHPNENLIVDDGTVQDDSLAVFGTDNATDEAKIKTENSTNEEVAIDNNKENSGN